MKRQHETPRQWALRRLAALARQDAARMRRAAVLRVHPAARERWRAKADELNALASHLAAQARGDS